MRSSQIREGAYISSEIAPLLPQSASDFILYFQELTHHFPYITFQHIMADIEICELSVDDSNPSNFVASVISVNEISEIPAEDTEKWNEVMNLLNVDLATYVSQGLDISEGVVQNSTEEHAEKQFQGRWKCPRPYIWVNFTQGSRG